MKCLNGRLEMLRLPVLRMRFEAIKDFYGFIVMLKCLVLKSPDFYRMRRVLLCLGAYFEDEVDPGFQDRDLFYLGYGNFLQGVMPYLDEFHAVMDPVDFELALERFSNFFHKCFPEYGLIKSKGVLK